MDNQQASGAEDTLTPVEYHYIRDHRKNPVVTIALQRAKDLTVDTLYFGLAVANPHDNLSKSVGRRIALTRLNSVGGELGHHNPRAVKLGGTTALTEDIWVAILRKLVEARSAYAVRLITRPEADEYSRAGAGTHFPREVLRRPELRQPVRLSEQPEVT